MNLMVKKTHEKIPLDVAEKKKNKPLNIIVDG
jgi:hypothetical protein